jgi:hypothetical protein
MDLGKDMLIFGKEFRTSRSFEIILIIETGA